VDQVYPDIAGERFGRPLGRGRVREDFHGLFSSGGAARLTPR
jgi:hypothetical protein